MAAFISTDQYLWGLRRLLDGISAWTASVPGGRETAGGDGDVGSAEGQLP
jgi:hypothetical protein